MCGCVCVLLQSFSPESLREAFFGGGASHEHSCCPTKRAMRRVISSFIKASCVKGWHTWLLASHTSHRDDSEMTQKHFKESKKELVLMTFRVCESVSVCVCARYLLVRQLEFLPVLKAITKVSYDFHWCANIFWRVFAFDGVCMSCWEGYTVPCNFRLIIRGSLGWCALKIFQGIYHYVKRSKEVWSPGRFSRMKSWESKV